MKVENQERKIEMNDYTNAVLAALSIINNTQCRATVEFCPIVNDTVMRDHIAVTDAPPKVITALMAEYPFCAVYEGKFLVPVTLPK
jgi:hypothetical protein